MFNSIATTIYLDFPIKSSYFAQPSLFNLVMVVSLSTLQHYLTSIDLFSVSEYMMWSLLVATIMLNVYIAVQYFTFRKQIANLHKLVAQFRYNIQNHKSSELPLSGSKMATVQTPWPSNMSLSKNQYNPAMSKLLWAKSSFSKISPVDSRFGKLDSNIFLDMQINDPTTSDYESVNSTWGGKKTLPMEFQGIFSQEGG